MKLSSWLNDTGTRACDFAKAIGTTEATISRLRHGRAQPSLDLAQRISEATGGAVTANDFMVRKSDGNLSAVETQSSNGGGNFDGKSVLLIMGGGIAAYKALDLIRRIKERGGAIRVILTEAAQEFVTPLSVSALAQEKAYTDLFDLKDEAEIGHIRLAREADLIVVAPATASLMAKMASGLADDLATATLLAADAPILLAPAMNPHMWAHAATRRNADRLVGDGVSLIGPNVGEMAESGESGLGRMAEVPEIIAALSARLGDAGDGLLAGLHVLITSGPTHEPLDPVRYVANRSSGHQGHAIAAAARQLGARVTLVSGPTREPDPPGVDTLHIETADQMMAAVECALPADIAVCAAAVADWKSQAIEPEKMKKQSGQETLTLTLERNRDILAALSQDSSRRPRLVIGFAAETERIVEHATRKRQAKGCDWIVANDVSSQTGIMGGSTNTVHVITAAGAEAWPSMAKTQVADKLMRRAARHMADLAQAAE
jgi:phosphopantothenoylcysteine decarboxylase/phosphopantothenate--cysteine ligase